MAKRRARKGEFWLSRDDRPNSTSAYEVYAGNDKPKLDDDGWFESDNGALWTWCAEEWEKLTPKSLHLKSGGGPIRIRVGRVE